MSRHKVYKKAGHSNFNYPSFKDQRLANRVRKEIQSLGSKIDVNIQPVFTSKKLSQILSVKEIKPPIVNTQRVVYLFEGD